MSQDILKGTINEGRNIIIIWGLPSKIACELLLCIESFEQEHCSVDNLGVHSTIPYRNSGIYVK